MASKPNLGSSQLELQISVLSELLHMLKAKAQGTRGTVAWQVLGYLNREPEFWAERRHWTVNQWFDMAMTDSEDGSEDDSFRQHHEPAGGFTLCGGQNARYGKQIQS